MRTKEVSSETSFLYNDYLTINGYITKYVSDDLVLQYVDYAISKGLKIIVKFHVGGAAGGGSANIQPTITSLWIESLRDIALSYCDLLGDKIDLLKI